MIVSSHLEYEDALEFGIDRQKLHIIPAGIDNSWFVERKPEAGENSAPLKLLFVGRVARVRRVELLLQAACRLSLPWTATIVGGEESTSSVQKGGYMDELRGLCTDLGITRQVTFAGPKNPDELKDAYRSADIFIYPSLYENFGQPLLEAAAAGLPIIATPVGLARELVEDGQNGFLVNADPAVIGQRIQSLADAKLRLAMGARLQQRARERYGWDEIIRKYIEIYRAF